jgi:acyl-CoA synthetase (NDP forming)
LGEVSPVDLLILATPAEAAPGLIREANALGAAQACIVISGGTDSQDVALAVAEGRLGQDGGMVVLGPNCMGVRSIPGKLDTFFIPADKLPPPEKVAPFAIVSQSGAFVVSRLSSMGALSPAIAISLGNQCDVTVSDLLWSLADREDLKAVGVYLEGFVELDGLETLRAVAEWTRRGKSVVFYKAGRTESGKSAAAGHTAAVAGDYEVALTALEHAGALVADSFRDFSQLLEVCALLGSGRGVRGRLFAVTNAGMEAVGMADAVSGEGRLSLARPGVDFDAKVAAVVAEHRLGGLVVAANPLDLTPMADEGAYDAVVSIALESADVDVVIVSCVPLAPTLRTLASDLCSNDAFPALVERWRSHSKPIVFVVDSGTCFDALAEAVRSRGIPVFRSADEAVKTLRVWVGR